MEIRIDLQALEQFAKRHQGADRVVREEIATTVNTIALDVQNRVVGTVPKRTGTLSRSYSALGQFASQSRLQARFGSNLPYAVVVEEGRGPVTIRPVNRKALAFTWGGKQFVVKSVTQPARRGGFHVQRAIRDRLDAAQRELDRLPVRIMKRLHG